MLESITSIITLILMIACAVLGAAIFYYKKVKPRYPKLTPLLFGVLCIVGTVGFVGVITAYFESDTGVCSSAEAIIKKESGDLPFIRSSNTPAERDATLRRYCARYAEECGTHESNDIQRLNEICARYR